MRVIEKTAGTALVTTAFSMATGWLTARALGPQGRGELSAVLLWPGILYSLASLGVFESLVYYLGKQPSERRKVVATATVLLMLLSLGVTVLAFIFVPRELGRYESQTRWLAQMYTLTIPLSTISMVGTTFLMGTLRFNWYNRMRLAMTMLTFLGTGLLLILHQGSVAWFVILNAVAIGVPLLVVWIAFRRKCLLPLPVSASLGRGMMAYGLRCYLAILCNTANQRLDQALIAVVLAPTYLGWYVVALSLANLAAIVPNTLSTIVFPVTVHSSREETRTALVGYIWLSLVSTGLVAFGVVLGCGVVIHLFYGDAFAGAITAARILALASIPLSVGQLLSYSCRALGKPGEAAKSEAVGLAVTLLSLPPLLLTLQIVGAALSSLLAYSATLGYLLWVTLRALEVAPRELLLATPESRATLGASMRKVFTLVDGRVHATARGADS